MKDSTVSARVEYKVKEKAEEILQKLGIPVSVIINSLYRQIIYNQGVPFPLTLPTVPKTLDELTGDELNNKLRHSYEQSISGQGKPMKAVFEEQK